MEKCGIKTDVTQLLRLLGPAMYKGNVLQVAVKELLQNSFDAVKKQDIASIDIETSRLQNTVVCKDNGVGMTAQTVKDVYLTIGGTLKDMDVTERSGGLGLAKVQFFLSASRIVVDTVRNGEHTVLDCSQEELLTGNAQLSVSRTTDPNGTTVTLYYPKEVHQLDGSITEISMPFGFSILNKPLLGYSNVVVRHNGYMSCKFDPKFTHTTSMEFPWGYVDIYYAPEDYCENSWGRNTEVYSAGLFQFSKQFHKDNIGDLKLEVMLNIRPKVAAGMMGYPFNNTREGFNVSVQDDVKTITKYLFDIQHVLDSERIRAQFAALTSLTYTDVDGKAFEKTTVAPGNNNVNYSPEFLLALQQAFASCGSIYERKAIVEEAETKIAASKDEVSKLYSESLKLNNRTTGTYYCIDVFNKLASVVLDIIHRLPESLNADRRPTIVGILIEKNTYGCLTTGNVNGIWINPLNSSGNSNRWTYDMMTTIIHELAHIEQEWHGEGHNSEMMRIAHWLIGEGLYTKLDGQLRAIFNQHYDEICDAMIEFSHSSSI